jgi:phosphohistidine phosphatase
MEVYILRHGIAENARAGMSDADRALTAEGEQKLREVLRSARKAKAEPALILTSPLRRAVETAAIAAEVLETHRKPVRTDALAPGSSPQEIWQEIQSNRSALSLLLAGHEPLLSQFLGYLLGCPTLEVDFKKGALARIDIDRFTGEPHGVLKWLLVSKLVS